MKKPEILRLIRLNFFKLLGAAIGLAVMVLMGYIQLTIISDEVVSLQNQLEEPGWTADRSFRMCWIAFSRDRRRTMRMNSSFNGS